MELSLDQFIRKNKIGVKPVKKGHPTPITKSLVRSHGRNERVVDARNMIIQKNRAKYRDAREKIVQMTKTNGDARLKLQKKRSNMPASRTFSNYHTSKLNSINPKMTLPQLIGVPRGYVDYDKMDIEEEDYQPPNVSLHRTIHNDAIPPFDIYNTSERSIGTHWNNDPFDCYEVPLNRPHDESESGGMHRLIRNLSPDILPPGILRPNRQASPAYSRRFIPEESSQLSYEMRSRLEHAPNPHTSMGIFANPMNQQSHSTSSQGFRIVVSNLHCSVTQTDIKELFEDIGELHEARLVRPGIAEVIFKLLKDAEKAVETYHNRQLDGQPMKCLLVNPRSSNKPTAPAIKSNNSTSSRSANKTPLEIDIDALHKVLFRRH